MLSTHRMCCAGMPTVVSEARLHTAASMVFVIML